MAQQVTNNNGNFSVVIILPSGSRVKFVEKWKYNKISFPKTLENGWASELASFATPGGPSNYCFMNGAADEAYEGPQPPSCPPNAATKFHTSQFNFGDAPRLSLTNTVLW